MTVEAIEKLAEACGYRADRSSSARLAYLLRDESGKVVASLWEGANDGTMIVASDPTDHDHCYLGFFGEAMCFGGYDADRLRKVFDRLKEGDK